MKTLFKFLLATLLVLGLAFSASAAPVVYNYSVEFSGADSPAGPGPWLRSTFEDTGTNEVTLTIESFLTGSEYVNEIYFNVDPFQTLTFTPVSSTGTFNLPSISQGSNTYKADGDGNFDILLNFANAPPAARFDLSDILVYTITGSNLTASDFFALSVGGGNSPDGLYTAAHILGIGSDGEGSGWVTVPVPAAAYLLGTGLLGLLAIRRKKTT